ncbi:HNH endonuclease signature motif containing protein [Nitrospirillum sp. BR 11828]|uniref:HNH endonuclease signature motif containing protein n=1 Tax=Nitrospirillum sp. BR 11828 TaxID=3104325 RepID=UPI002ACA389C|nr:HNH endonuclease signature motif containing protein [Nitrospirillum sp. BR 11828]MDZ5647579.1 HNH endonuclease signature motif containing protein [Nitrospirillum sp. BR 11828]
MGKARDSRDGTPPDGPNGICALCDRPLVPGPSVELHHLVPRSEGGRVTVPLHRVCHRKIHAELTERELAVAYATVEALRAHPAIAAFIRWVANKPPEFTTRTAPRRR